MKFRKAGEGLFDALRRFRRGHAGVKVAGTRLIVAAATWLLFHLANIPNHEQISAVVLVYAAVISLFVLTFRTVIEQRRFRLAAIIMDIAAISILVKVDGTAGTSWFLLYVFPIMSLARYLGIRWSFGVSLVAAGMYWWALLPLAGLESFATFGVRAFMLVAVAFTAAKLARTRYREEETFTEMLRVADHLIVTTAELDAALKKILHLAIKMTRSDVSVIAIENDGLLSTYVADGSDDETTVASREAHDELKAILTSHYKRVVRTRRPIPLAKRGLGALVGGLGSEKTWGWSGRLVPLTIGGPPFAVLGVFSRNSIHYRPDDVLKLSRVASVVAMLQRNASVVSRPLVQEAADLRQANEVISRLREENEARLRMLYDIGDLLENEVGLAEVFTKIVSIVSTRLRSEEAALFLWDEHEELLLKKAVAGPGEAITARLFTVERSYRRGESFTGTVFESRESKSINDIPPDTAHVHEYEECLPSGCTKHYLGVPLVIGDEVLGVIRVLNRKSPDYVPQPGLAKLEDVGFEPADLELLTMTARLIAVAIRSAGFVEQKKYFENLVYRSPDPIIVLDENSRIKNFNRACRDIWHVTERDVIGQSVARFYKSREHAREIAEAIANAEEHTIHDHEAWIRVDGQIVPIRLSATEFRTKADKFAGSIGIFKDARQEHRDRLGALTKLSRASSHDIKNDVMAIYHSLPYLEKAARANAEAASSYEAIRKATGDALAKLQSLLMAAHTPSASFGPVAIGSEIRAFAASMCDRLDAAKVKFSLTTPDDDAYVSADRDQLRHVFANLLGNSIDAILSAKRPPRERRIDVTLRVMPTRIVVQWRDNGTGMPDQDARDAFTAFYTTKKEGNGLGLYINKTIVEGHGGDIAIDSVVGSGTCITIGLPLNRWKSSQASVPEEASSVGGDALS